MKDSSSKTFDIENLDLWVLQYSRRKPFIFSLFLVLLILVSISPFIVEFFMEERLLTQADVYDTSRPLFYLHLCTDLAIGLSYFFITSVLIYLTVQAGRAIPFLWAFVAFGVFIVACGMTHFMEAFVMWQPIYWVAGGIKWLTAVVSVGTAITIPFLVPKALSLIEIAQVAQDRKQKLEDSYAELTMQNQELDKRATELHKKQIELEETQEQVLKQKRELEKSNKFLIGRENIMAEQKKRIKELEDKLSDGS